VNYLVDTSVWVDYIQGRTTEATDYLDDILAMPAVVGINYQIYLEILQGARSQEAFTHLQSYFSTQRFYGFADDMIGYERSAELYCQCRLRGITIRSSIDCLIAQCAIENELRLLHQDRDFIRLQTAVPEFEHVHFLD
jgi:predicted nucleic acid-binding protein